MDANVLPHTTPGPLGGEDAPIESSLPEAARLCNLHHLSKVSVALNQAYISTSWAPVTKGNSHRVDQEVAEMTSSMLLQCRQKHPQKPRGIRLSLTGNMTRISNRNITVDGMQNIQDQTRLCCRYRRQIRLAI